MATTNLFVELLVIGVGAACWVGLLILAAFGIEFTQSEVLNAYPVLMSLLAIAYLLGIITDRIADFVFDKCFSKSLHAQFFDEKREYQDASVSFLIVPSGWQRCMSMLAHGFEFAAAGH